MACRQGRGHYINNEHSVIKQEAPGVSADTIVLDWMFVSLPENLPDSLTGTAPNLFRHLPLFDLYYNYLTHTPLDHRFIWLLLYHFIMCCTSTDLNVWYFAWISSMSPSKSIHLQLPSTYHIPATYWYRCSEHKVVQKTSIPAPRNS